MLELFSPSESFLDRLKWDDEFSKGEESLKFILETHGFKLEGLTKEIFCEHLPFFFVRPFNFLSAEIFLVAHEHRLIHNFFFDLVTAGIIKKKILSILSSYSYRFYDGSRYYLLLVAKVEFQSELELNLCLENVPEYLNRVRLSTFSIQSKTINAEYLSFGSEIKKGLISEKFLKFFEKFQFGSRFDAFTFCHHKLNELDFLLSYLPACSSRILLTIFHQYLVFSNQPLSEIHRFKLKLIKIQNEFSSDLNQKLGCILSFNLRNKFELFDLDTFIKFLHQGQKKICLEKIQEISFKDEREVNFKMFYLEFQFSLDHLFEVVSYKRIKEFISSLALQSIKQLTLPLFKPRNEEEVLKDFVLLAKQVTHPSDIPQVIVHFDRHDPHQLIFRVILIRVKRIEEVSLEKRLEVLKEISNVTIERVKILGMIRKKYPKEACVVTYRLKTILFVRDDHTIDFQKARLQVMQNLMKVFGPVRDFEGGMIAKQAEAFNDFQRICLEKVHTKQITLENFFYGINPAEYRSLISQEILLDVFLWWKKEKDKKQKETPDTYLFFKQYSNESMAKFDIEYLEEKGIKIHEGFWLKFTYEGVFYLGIYIKEVGLKEEIKNHFRLNQQST